MAGKETYKRKIAKAFEKTLNRHGYGFHYSVLKKAHEVCESRESLWIFEVVEFPVKVRNHDTRIDFILRHQNKPSLILAECKTANPALLNWCFATSPYIRRNRSHTRVHMECTQIDESGNIFSFANSTSTPKESYHIALEVRSNKKGDSRGTGRGAIEGAATQVIQGLNGFVSFLATNANFFQNKNKLILIPAIFTTAQLWVSNVDLSVADLKTGKVNLDEERFIQKDWVLYQYHTSPGLKHTYRNLERTKQTLGDILESEYVRTIPIISPSGIGDFLSWVGHLR